VSVLGRPAVVAVLALVVAALVQPDLGFVDRLPAGDGLLAGSVALLVVALLAGGSGAPSRLLAVAVAAVAVAFAYDAVRGAHGRLAAAPGSATQTFEEIGPEGRPLGLRPFGMEVVVGEANPDRVRLTAGGRDVAITPGRAASIGGYRMGLAGRTAAAGVTLLLGITHPDGRETGVRLEPGLTATDGPFTIALEMYYPDFALDDRQQPFTRSERHDNPAALLRVRRGETGWRVFVLRAAPGLHRPEGLDRVFRLVDIEAAEAVELQVSREPAAPIAGVGLLVAAAAVVLGRRRA
jgi:hypothetical protein